MNQYTGQDVLDRTQKAAMTVAIEAAIRNLQLLKITAMTHLDTKEKNEMDDKVKPLLDYLYNYLYN